MKKQISYLSRFLILLMIFTVVVPVNSIASGTVKDNYSNVENKLDGKLLQAFQKEEYTQYLVILHDQTDTKKVADQARKEAAAKSLSVEKVKGTIQEAVVAELQLNAEKKQKNVLSYIAKDKKNIQEYESYFIINGLAVTGTKQSAEEIARMPEVKSVILDGKQKLPELKETNLADTIEWNIERVGAPEVWERGVTGKGAVVANIDSGVEGNHPALKEKYRGYNLDDPANPTHEFNWHDAVAGRGSPMDSDGHGTHTMGTMVGLEDDDIIGVAPDAQWISARAFFNNEGYDSYIIEAAQWVLAPTDENGVPHPDKAPDVVNNSWGGSPINNDWFLPMVEAWRAAGIVPVFSVGNAGLFQDADPGTASAPGNYREVIAVGATDNNDELADFSLRGPSEEGAIKPDIAAPGVSIRSSIPGDRWDEFEYGFSNGTSMAAPHVAATILLMKEADPALTIEQVETILKVTAQTKTNEDYPNSPNNGYGYGILDAAAAVEAVQQGIGTIQGKITGPGVDEESPIYEHDPRSIVFTGQNETFSIQAIDNLSVNSVTLTIQLENNEETTYTAKLADGDHLNGIYEAIVPAEDLTGEKFDYWWSIEDYSGNQTQTEAYQVIIAEAVSEGYIENFEGYPDGWYSYGINNSWEWGIPEYGPDKAASGEKVMGTHLRGLYGMNADMTLMMPPVFAEEETVLRFKTWYKLSSFGSDTGTVFVSTDKENWEALYQVRLENTRWHEVGLDLSAYAGEKVYLAFNLQTGDNENAGWYIDDVQVVENNPNLELTNQLYDEKQSLTLPVEKQDVFKQTLEKQNAEVMNAGLPEEAEITVKETGWETTSSLQNGEFTIHHAPGDYTLLVDAYGFERETIEVTLDANGFVSPEVQLTPLPRQIISGEITNGNGEAIEDVTVFLLEDEKASPVQSAEDGSYLLHAYPGTYTLKVFADGYNGISETVEVKADEDIMLDLNLTAFNRTETSEIKYDNGSYGRNLAFGKKGNGFAVKMSLEEGEASALVTGAKLQFWAEHVPVPGGDDILVSVYDANGENGAPGHKLAGPIEAKAARDLSKWTEVDLSHLGIVVEDDFYIVYLQADDYPYIPGFVTDGDSANYAKRSWDYIGGQWFEANQRTGNYMIRAEVDYGGEAEFVAPVITSPESGLLTNEAEVTMEGTAQASTTLQLLNNGEEVYRAEVGNDGKFSIPVVLDEGENELLAVSLINDEAIAESEKVIVELDTKAPELTIVSPQDGDTIDSEQVIVEGTVLDKHLGKVEVNGEEAAVGENGSFAAELTLSEGEQNISVQAFDRAGNTSQEEVTIYIELGEDTFTLENITPFEDVYLKAGESVQIAFDSEPGLKASYMIHIPLEGDTPQVVPPLELPMLEVGNGHYVGYWTAPRSIVVDSGARIEVKARDNLKNEVTQTADGKLFINVGE